MDDTLRNVDVAGAAGVPGVRLKKAAFVAFCAFKGAMNGIERAELAGWNRVTVDRLVKGQSDTGVRRLVLLARELGCKVEDLIEVDGQ